MKLQFVEDILEETLAGSNGATNLDLLPTPSPGSLPFLSSQSGPGYFPFPTS